MHNNIVTLVRNTETCCERSACRKVLLNFIQINVIYQETSQNKPDNKYNFSIGILKLATNFQYIRILLYIQWSRY
jgi:hypothetical protein